MRLSNEANKLLSEIIKLHEMDKLNEPNRWENKMNRLSPDKQRKLFDALEELESEGFITMRIKERENCCPIPSIIIYKSAD